MFVLRIDNKKFVKLIHCTVASNIESIRIQGSVSIPTKPTDPDPRKLSGPGSATLVAFISHYRDWGTRD